MHHAAHQDEDGARPDRTVQEAAGVYKRTNRIITPITVQ
jgi:hypothetical protein